MNFVYIAIHSVSTIKYLTFAVFTVTIFPPQSILHFACIILFQMKVHGIFVFPGTLSLFQYLYNVVVTGNLS